MGAITEVTGLRKCFGQTAIFTKKDTNMNDTTGAGRVRPRRAGLLAVTALASTALLAAACGGDNGGDNGNRAKAPGRQTQSGYDQALAYAKCMRENGVPNWPDPESSGLTANNNGSLDRVRASAGYKKAAAACKSLEAQGPPPAAQIEQEFAKLLKFSKCMRENGVPKFPDPVKENGGVGIATGNDVDPNSSQYKAATNACKSLSPDGG
jgi:hypothetical protein